MHVAVALQVVQGRVVGGVALPGISDLERGEVGGSENEDEEDYQDVALHVVQERGVGGVALFGVSDLERGDVGCKE